MNDIEKAMIINECGCVVDEGLLLRLIQQRCNKLNKSFKPPYRITAPPNGYARICIAHHWFRVHRLIGEYLYGELNNNHVHHKDNNKLNNDIDNLELLTPSEHAKETFRRNDVTKEKIEELLKQGHTKVEIAGLLKCATNTVYSRLEMKDY